MYWQKGGFELCSPVRVDTSAELLRHVRFGCAANGRCRPGFCVEVRLFLENRTIVAANARTGVDPTWTAGRDFAIENGRKVNMGRERRALPGCCWFFRWRVTSPARTNRMATNATAKTATMVTVMSTASGRTFFQGKLRISRAQICCCAIVHKCTSAVVLDLRLNQLAEVRLQPLVSLPSGASTRPRRRRGSR